VHAGATRPCQVGADSFEAGGMRGQSRMLSANPEIDLRSHAIATLACTMVSVATRGEVGN
jgi:hypothetical protein